MNWRRGLIFATVHLCLAVPLIVEQEAQSWPYLKARRTAPVAAMAASQDDGEMGSRPIILDRYLDPPEAVVQFSNMPAYILTAWHYDPHSRLSVAGMAEMAWGLRTRASALATAIGFTLLIALQWFFVGGFPLNHPKKRWQELGTFITLCAVVAVPLSFWPEHRELSLALR